MSLLRTSLESHLPALTIFDSQTSAPVFTSSDSSERFVGSDPVAGFKRLIADAKSQMEKTRFENDAEILSSLVARQSGLGELASRFASIVG